MLTEKILHLIKKTDVDVHYILELIKKLKSKVDGDKIAESEIYELVDASVHIRSKKTLIQNFIKAYDAALEWADFVKQSKQEDFDKLVSTHKLDVEKTKQFIDKCFKQGYVDAERDSIDITGLMKAKINLLMGDEYIKKQKQIVVDAINEYFETYNEL